MKNKNISLFKLGTSLLRERFLVFKGGQPASPAEDAEAKKLDQTANQLFDKINAVINKPADKLTWDPEKNPYATDFDKRLKALPDLSKVTFSSFEKKDGQLVLKYDEAGTAKELKFEGVEYRAIFWGEIGKQLGVLFAGKNVSIELLDLATNNTKDAPKFEQLLDKVAKDPTSVKVGDTLVDEAYKELEALRKQLDLSAAQDREKIKVGIEAKTGRDITSLEVERKRIQLPDSSTVTNTKFIEMADDEKATKFNGLDIAKLNVERERLKVDPNQWNTTTDESLNRVYVDWRTLGIPVADPFYRKMFCVLRDKNNPTKQAILKSHPEYAEWFRHPDDNLDNISKITPDSGQTYNDFPQAFVKAYAHFAYIKANILSLGLQQKETLEKQRGLDGHALVDKPMDFVRANYTKFTQAIKEHDYATAGLYVLGIYAFYKSIKSLAGDNAETAKKYLFYGIAGYCGYVFAKNAGYDILKMAGFKDQDAEVRGTPMEAIAAMNLPEAKDLDSDILLRVSEVKVTDLNKLFEQANTHGQYFIHPSQFPQIFPDLARIGSFPMGIGEQGLMDHAGNMYKKLTPQQREYVRVGEQLYKVMLVLRAAYDKTLLGETGKSFNDAMEKDEVMRDMKIRHFCSMLGLYALPSSEAGPIASRAIDKARGQLDAAFASYKETEVGAKIDENVKSGIYKGHVMGFPVYFVYSTAAKHFRVYLANDYGTNDIPGRKYSAEIPLEGEALQKNQIGKLVKAINGRMEKLLGMIKTNGKPPSFDGGKWVATVKMPGNPEFDIAEHDSKVKLEPNSTGDGLLVYMEGCDAPFSLDEHNAERIPLTMNLIHGLFNNPDFEMLKPFANLQMINVSDPTKGDSKFTLQISKLSKTLEIQYNKKTDTTPAKFVLATPADEAEFLKDPAFSSTYVEALDKQTGFELNQSYKALEGIIGSLNTSVWSRIGDAVMGNTSGGPMSRWDITSKGVPQNYAKMVIENSRQTVLARVQYAVEGKTKFSDVEVARKNTLADANNKIKAIKQAISDKDGELRQKGESWDQNEFMGIVVDQIRLASTISSSYGSAQADMERTIYSLDLPGLEGFDFAKGAHRSAGKLMQVFVYHTAHLDNQMHKFVLPDPADPKKTIEKTQIVGLDPPALVFPPTATKGITIPEEDPGLRGHMINNYFKYVKEHIETGARQLQSLEAMYIPGPKAPQWGIMDFDEWAKTEGKTQALDTLDNLPAFKHDLVDHKAGKHTEFDEAMKSEYDKAVTFLTNELGPGVLNTKAINEYLRGTADKTSLGLFVRSENPPKSGKFESKLWNVTDRIALTSGITRSKQVQAIQTEVQKFVTLIFTKDPVDGYKFLNQEPSLWEKGKLAIIRRWPGLATFHIF